MVFSLLRTVIGSKNLAPLSRQISFETKTNNVLITRFPALRLLVIFFL